MTSADQVTSDRTGLLPPPRTRPSRAERLLLPAALITNLGNSVQLTAAAVLIFSANQTTMAVGGLFIAVAIPQMLLSLVFGGLVDRLDRRTLCLLADVGSGLVALALPVWLWLGGPADRAATTVSFVLALLAALFMPASNALIKERVPDERLARFNADFEIWVQAGTLLSAAAGGFAIQLFGVMPLFVFNGLTFVASAVLMYALGRRPAPSAVDGPGAKHTRPQLRDRGEDLVRLGLLYALGNVVIMAGNATLLVLILRGFNSSVGMLGVAEALFGIGVVAAATTYQWATRRVSGLRIALIGNLGFALMLMLETIHLWVMLAAIPFAGITFGLARISARTMLMKATPDSRVGRVFGATNAAGLAIGAVVTVAISLLMDHTEPRYGFYALAAFIACGSTALALPRRTPHRGRPACRPNPADSGRSEE